MASKRIKGITIEIGADTRKLTDEIKKAEKEINDAAYKLRDINKLLKLDPKNTELLTQKQKALKEAIDGTREKLKQEQEAMRQLEMGPQTAEAKQQQEALGREIIETKQKLESLEKEYVEFGSVAGAQTRAAGEEMKKAGQKMQDIGGGIRDVGQTMTQHVTVPIVAGFGASAKAAIDWETAFTGVRKTVDASEEEYAQLEKNIKQMSTEMASSKEEIAGVMEIAGQLGVRGVDNLTAFTKTAVMLGDTTNLSSEEAATALARVLNITGDGYDKIDRLGSVVVDLGNNYATTESEITEMASRLASAGKIAGFSTQEIFGIAAAMSSVNIKAEEGGTAMATTFKNIQAAVSDFTKEGATEKEKKNLETLAKVAGMTADEFANAWKSKPMDALQSFIKGLTTLKDTGGDTFAVLDELGMSGIRQSNMLQALALASGMMGDATETANKAWNENSALTEEAAKRYATMAAKLTQMKEQLGNLAIMLGERLMPYLEKFMGFLDKVITKLEGMSDEELDAAIKIGAFLAAIGPVLTILGNIVIFAGKVTWALGSLKTAFAGISSIGATAELAGGGIAGLGSAIMGLLGPIALVAAAIAVWVANWEQIKEAGQLFVERTKEHLELIKQDWIAVCDAIKEYVPAKFNEIKESVLLAVSLLKEGLIYDFNFLTAGIQEKIEFIKGVMDGGWQYIYDTVTQKAQGMFQTVKGVFEEFSGWIGGFIQKAKTWGSELVSNIAEGIKSGVGKVKEAVTSVGNAVKERLHFSEPDVGPLSDFNSWMPDMMKQMAQQINQGIPGVQNAIQSVAGTMQSGLQKDYSGQLSNINNSIGRLAGAGGDITIPVYIGNQKFAQAVVAANQTNNYRSGGR